MDRTPVVIFQPYPFQVGEKIAILQGPRQGDWEVIGVSERKMTLRCPISGREFEWDRFCYHVETSQSRPWPNHGR